MRNIYALEIMGIVLIIFLTTKSLFSFNNFYEKSNEVIIETKQVLSEYQNELVANFDDFSFNQLNKLDLQFISNCLSSK